MRQTIKNIIKFFTAVIIFSAIVNKSYPQVTDIDSNVYKTVIIGNQEWMAENLNVEHYRNGDPILQVEEINKSSAFKTGAWCYYDNDLENEKTYAKLYDWYAVNDARGLAPEGWHIPSYEEWQQLIDFLGGDKVAGGKLKATILWESPNTGATNESGFTALPGGFLTYRLQFLSKNQSSYFWSSTKANDKLDIRAWGYAMNYDKSDVNRYEPYKYEGRSVRCVKD